MRYEHDHGCPTADEAESDRQAGRRYLLVVAMIVVSCLVAAVFSWHDAHSATANIYWRVDLNQGTSIIAYGQGATEQAAWEDCFRLQAITRAMTAAETRKIAVSAVSSSVVRWCKNPIRYATVSPDAVSAILRWSYPDGVSIDGFRVVYGERADQMVNSVNIPSPAARTYSFVSLAPGTYYFAVLAYKSGKDSALSDVGTKVVM